MIEFLIFLLLQIFNPWFWGGLIIVVGGGLFVAACMGEVSETKRPTPRPTNKDLER